ncbi:hypothetical protein P0D68_13410 [Paraburkholderia sp. RL17-380-BIE-A]|uniref:hypothetical protein n=1 Tax=Paraburkholderia sp. RL17-380-BIE-A TaxID=3031630 RepID=UPI0038BB4640
MIVIKQSLRVSIALSASAMTVHAVRFYNRYCANCEKHEVLFDFYCAQRNSNGFAIVRAD